jgi:hypothetical protein
MSTSRDERMPVVTVKARSAWEDRFRAPTWEELRGASNKQIAGLLEHARERLLHLPEARERLAWHGIPWRWSLAFSVATADPDRPVAFLVPQPNHPRLAVPLAAEVLAQINLPRFSKPVREAILHAPQVGGVRWPSWELVNRTQFSELHELIEARLKASAGVTLGV